MQRLGLGSRDPKINMATCLDEISSQGCSTNSERALSSNEWQKLQDIHQQVGVVKLRHLTSTHAP